MKNFKIVSVRRTRYGYEYLIEQALYTYNSPKRLSSVITYHYISNDSALYDHRNSLAIQHYICHLAKRDGVKTILKF